MDNKKLQFYFFIGLLLIIFVLTLALFAPFLAPLALAFMAAIVVRPLHRKILGKVKNRRGLAALLSVLFVLVVILVPLTFIAYQATVESYNFYVDVRSGQNSLTSLIDGATMPIRNFFPTWQPDFEGYLQSFSDSVLSNAQSIFSNAANIALGTFVMFVALFYMLRDGHKFRETIVELSPLADAYDKEIIEKIEKAVNSVVKGSLFTSLVKGVFAALGFALFGVPHAILWGALTAIVSLLPAVGAGLTLIPAVLYLVATNAIGPAIGLAVWGTLVVGLVDNVLMPVIVGKGFTVHPLFVLLSVVGGLIFFGPVGLALGPLVVAFLSALLEIYKLIVIGDHGKPGTIVK